ncbi:hypothetical protein DFP91_4914 [Pseudorhodoplanes sinuspersici]|nr:hypothetical protein DFP91_4914 [Pseudorhodoplanes sinuspersici]
MIRLTGRGSPAEDNKKSRPVSSGPRCLSSGVVAEQASNTARGAPDSFGGSWCYQSHALYSHRAWGRGQAESPAFRAPLDFKGKLRRLDDGRARAG